MKAPEFPPTLRERMEASIVVVIFSLILVLIIIFITSPSADDMKARFTAKCCCNGSFCTDTYWDAKTGLCHLTLYGDSTYNSTCNPISETIAYSR
jgi:hypothetical protein